MTYDGRLPPPGQYTGQPHQQFSGYQLTQQQQQQQQQQRQQAQIQQAQRQQQQQRQHQFARSQGQAFPSQQISYDYHGFNTQQAPPQQQQLDQWKGYNAGVFSNTNGGVVVNGGGAHGMTEEQYLPPTNVWQHQQQQQMSSHHLQQQQQPPQQQGCYPMASPQATRQPVPSPQQSLTLSSPQTIHPNAMLREHHYHQAQIQTQQMRNLHHHTLTRSPSISQQRIQQQQQQIPASPQQHVQTSHNQNLQQVQPFSPQQHVALSQQKLQQQQQQLQQQYQQRQMQSHNQQSSPIMQQHSVPRPRPAQPTVQGPRHSSQSPQVQAKPQPRKQSQSHLQIQQQVQPPAQTQTQTRQPAQSRSPVPQPPQTLPQAPPPQESVAEPPMQFVNMADLQQIPLAAPRSLNTSFSTETRPSPQPGQTSRKRPSPEEVSTAKKPRLDAAMPVQQRAAPNPQTSVVKPNQSPSIRPSQSPAMTPRRISQSPALSTKPSPRLNKESLYNTTSMMVGAAEEMINKARSSASAIAARPDPVNVEEYQKLIGTGLACLEAAIQSQRLSPRQEARVRLRYAAVLLEETENLMEAETTLSKGITLCDKHRMMDLKYCMQYLMMKVLFQRNRKAALKALDQHIKDCDAYQHTQWSYAFRLLKASFYAETGASSDATALDNFRSIHNLASARGDSAVSVFASLSEALILLKTCRATPEAIQSCMAQAAKYQLDPTVNISQLELMSLLVSLLSSLNREKQEDQFEKLRALQKRIRAWKESGESTGAQFYLPIKKHAASGGTISRDTSAIIHPGGEGNSSDFLVMSLMSEMEYSSIGFVMGGLVRLHKPSESNCWGENPSRDLWSGGLNLLTHWDQHPAMSTSNSLVPLSQAIRQSNWRNDIRCYLNILLSLLAGSQCAWGVAKKHLDTAEQLFATSQQQSVLKSYLVYLKGAYCQATGRFDMALALYRDESLAINPPNHTPHKPSQRHLAVIAGMNQLWIMQHPSHTNHTTTDSLMTELDPLCRGHPNIDILTLWECTLATVKTDPPRTRVQRKADVARALKIATRNSLATVITLVVAHELLYTGQDEQSTACLVAANRWSARCANPMWQSVVDGINAETEDVRNNREKSRLYWGRGLERARAAFSWGGLGGIE